jgi:dUTP pyrophosphatase
MEIRILDQRLNQPELMPAYATPGSAALDLRACNAHGSALDDATTLVVPAGDTVMVGTGIAVHLETVTSDRYESDQDGKGVFAGLILPRSGVGCKQGLVPGNLVGLIDPDYTGELKICLWNRSKEAQSIKGLDRIAQLMIVPAFRPVLTVVEQFTATTARGDGGFGSTGS